MPGVCSGWQSQHIASASWTWRRCGLLSSTCFIFHTLTPWAPGLGAPCAVFLAYFSYSDSPRTRSRRFCAVFLAKCA